MLTKFRTLSHVKLVAVSLIGLVLLTSCGGGGEDTNNDDRTARPMLSLSELTPDTSQGKTIIVDYQGPAFDEEDLSVSVGDTFVESVFVNDQIHLILPLTQLGETSLEFNFGGFSSNLSADIAAAPAIADPPAYVSNMVGDLVAELDALSTGDWQNEIDALYAAEQELSNLSEAEIRELAIFLKQNVEPLLLQLNAPVVAQFDEAACENEMRRFVFSRQVVTASIGVAVVYLAAPEPSKAVGFPLMLAGVVAGAALTVRATEEVLNACLLPVVADIRAALVTTAGVKVAQQGPETISTIHFDEGQATAVTLSLNRTFDPQRRPEFVNTIQSFGDLLLKLNNGLRSVRDNLPGFLSWLAGGIESFIAKFDGFISTFAGLENPDRVAAVDHADFRLVGISDDSITGTITDAGPERLFLEFNFGDRTTVPQDGCVDFDFTLSSTHVGLEDVNVPGRLCALQSEATIMAGRSPVAAGANATFRVTFYPALSFDITFRQTTIWQRANGSSSRRTLERTVSRGTGTLNLGAGTNDNHRAVTVEIQSGIGYTVGSPGSAKVRVKDDGDDDNGDDDTRVDADYLLCAGYLPVNTEEYIYTFGTWRGVHGLRGYYFTGAYSYNVSQPGTWTGGAAIVFAGPHCSACRADEVSVATPGGVSTVGCSEYEDTINEAWEDIYQTPILAFPISCDISNQQIQAMCSS